MSDLSEKMNYKPAMAVVTTLFFMWGFLTCMNDILIPYLKSVFVLSYLETMLIQFSFFSAYFIGSAIYFIVSILSGDPINKIGYKNGIILGLTISTIGSALFYPASILKSYEFFLAALFILCFGFSILQIAANPYVAILGSAQNASSRLNLSQGFNSLGTTMAPLIGGYLVFNHFGGTSADNAEAVQVPYMIFTGFLILLIVFVSATKLPRITNKETIEKGAGALKYPHLVLGIIAIFMYVGGEVSIGSLLMNFLGLEEITGMKEEEASIYVSIYWGGLMIGRFLGAVSLSKSQNESTKVLVMAAIPIIAFSIIAYFIGMDIALIYGVLLILNFAAFFFGRFLPARTVFVFSLIIIAMLIVTISTKGEIAMWALISVGLFNSIMWSNIFTLAIAGLGKHTSQGSSLLVLACVGAGVVPMIQGAFADSVGLHLSFFVPIICYIYIAFYGWKGYKIRKIMNGEL